MPRHARGSRGSHAATNPTRRPAARAGPTWTRGTPEEQPDWDAHAEFIDELIERGVFMGGRWSTRLGSMSIWEGMNADEVHAVMQRGPFVLNGVFEIEDVADWTVYVDTRVE